MDMKRLVKFKKIVKQGKVFLYRINIYIKKGSIKIHLIMNDDIGEPHKHPWDFSSFLLFGAYKEFLDGNDLKHKPFSLLKRDKNQIHKVTLYRIFGVKIPCITVGRYSEKKQSWCKGFPLCDYCKKVGYCIDKKEWNLPQNPELTNAN